MFDSNGYQCKKIKNNIASKIMASNNVRGVSRILTKLENSVKSGDYYEAHQMYRTLYFR